MGSTGTICGLGERIIRVLLYEYRKHGSTTKDLVLMRLTGVISRLGLMDDNNTTIIVVRYSKLILLSLMLLLELLQLL